MNIARSGSQANAVRLRDSDVGRSIGVRQLNNLEVVELLGNTNLASATNLYVVKVAKTTHKLEDLCSGAVEQISAVPGGGSESVSADRFEHVPDARVSMRIQKATGGRLDQLEHGDKDDGNIQYYKAAEVNALIKALRAQVGHSAKLMVAVWDDSNSECYGLMIAAQKPDTKEVVVAKVVSYLP